MKLTQRQLDKIAGLINEEAEVRKNLHESMYESRRQSVAQETLLFEGLDPDNMPEALFSSLDDEMTNYSQQLLNAPRGRLDSRTINDIVYKELSNMYYDISGRGADPEILRENLDNFDADELYSLEVTLVNSIKVAIDEYILGLGRLAVNEYKSSK